MLKCEITVNFLNANKKIKDFNETLMITHGKEIDDSLFYAICYAIRFKKNQKGREML